MLFRSTALVNKQNIKDTLGAFGSAGESMVRGAGSAILGGLGDMFDYARTTPFIPGVTDKVNVDFLPGASTFTRDFPKAPPQSFAGIPYATSKDILETFPQRYTPQFGDKEANTFMENLGYAMMPYGVNKGQQFMEEGLKLASQMPNMTREAAQNFAMDYANARHGIYPQQPTMGSRAADLVKKSEPVLEKGLTMYEQGKFTPGFNPVSEALRPTGGGNNPLNLGGVGATGGEMGRYLSALSNVEPFEVWKELLPNDAPSFNRYVERYFDEHGNGVRPSDISSDHGTLLYEQARALLKEAVDNFSNTVNPIRIANNQSPIPTYSAVENIMPSFNSWIYEGPYKKYITTQMGTGAATDPALKAIEQYNLPLATKELHDWVPKNAAERREKVLGIL